MKNFFLVSRYSEDIYSYIVDKCYSDIKKTDKRKIEIKRIEIKKYPDFKFLLSCFFFMLKGDFFQKEKIVLLKYQNINFGKHLLSITFRSYKSYLSFFTFYYVLFKNILIVSRYFKTADYYLNNFHFKYAYLDHIEYLNGILYHKFVKNNKKIYSNRFPRSIIKTKEKNIEKLFEIEFKKKRYTKKKLKKITNSTKKIFTSIRDYLPWLHHTVFNKFKNKDLKKYKYIVYAHSFTDGQLEHPYDGFVNSLEWLKFTVNELRGKNVNFIVKGHPNFYMKSSVKGITEIADWDKKIYQKFFKDIINDKNILIINQPVLNYEIVKKLDKKCIVITKHGSVQLEMIYHNFKVITSKSNFINPKYSLTNMWNNKYQYKKLLKKNWHELKFAKKNDFYSAIESLFLDEVKAFGKKYYLNALKNFMIKANIIKKNSSYEEMILKFKTLKNKKKIIKKIKLPIINV